jgi:predicted double-glycine peptidase
MTYKQALKTKGPIADLAAICQSIQFSCGAVSSQLVFEGAQKKGLTAKQLMEMAHKHPQQVEELQWN